MTPRKEGVKENAPDYQWINQNRCGRVAEPDLLAGKGGVLSLRVSGFLSRIGGPLSISSVISASIRAIPTGAGRAGAGRAGRAGGVPGLESVVLSLSLSLSLSWLATLVIPCIFDMVDTAVTGVDSCPCNVALVPPVLGLLTCRERGWLSWGATMAPRRGRVCGKRLAPRGALVEGLGTGRGLDRTGATLDGNPILGFLMADWRGGRLVGVGGCLPGL